MAENSNSKAKVTLLTTGIVLGLVGIGLGTVELMGSKAEKPSFRASRLSGDDISELRRSLDEVEATNNLDAKLVDTAPLDVRSKTGQNGAAPRLAPLFFAPQLWQINQGDRNIVVDIYDEASPTIHPGIPNLWFINNGLIADMGKAGAADMDNDGDGFTNREEYNGKTNPVGPDSYPSLISPEGIVKIEAVKVESLRASLVVEAMFSDPTYETDKVGITVTKLTKRGEPTAVVEKKDYKVGDDVKVLTEPKRYRIAGFGQKTYDTSYGSKETERVLLLTDYYDPKAGEVTVRAGKPRANEHEQLRRGLDIKDTTVTFRITAGKQRGQEFKVRLGQSFRVPGCETDCVLREVNEQQDSVTLSIDGLESPVNVPRVDGEAS